ncbi:MAG: tRNA 2-selenouridine(34) synthase MnmH [Bacteroidetes bacterium]|jgi:tRNA 2-selenouridine synthase|nr:tRNA 2-selenouridine(34) synthase MnmH [Bacteroidota bacterium]MBT6684975.1 tRNA 2-selenouridine(34) synthase MnmH [Bacteroidota bacterium]MBT7143053.1 tRNA 2-selenouridine(34) synthase MnmH [Bacteroidota bacterium]MBT7491534.1 tRNA 2-selenouridine(34) synthase MnmH [Bacteroidota bacterium]
MTKIEIDEFLKLSEKHPVIDVRSPVEFEKGHIPNAINIPLFTNSEREQIGKKYKESGNEKATLLGLEMVGPKLTVYINKLKKVTKQKKVLLHCWRGGKRSESMAWLFSQVGYEILVLDGGYKRFRNFVLSSFCRKAKIIVLGGMTGSRKSEILRKIEEKGHQILDLELLANHKGSAFGSIGKEEQPTVEYFENLLFEKWQKFDFSKPIWFEDESATIGKARIPNELYKQMRNSPVLKISVPIEKRIDKLIEEYADFDKKIILSSILKIEKRLGGLNTKRAIEALEKNDFYTLVNLVLNYYDKAYNFGLSQRNTDTMFSLKLIDEKIEKNVEIVLDFAKEKMYL